jgi:hypothetical protein
MSIKDHPVFETPNENQLLWRYMSFPKFVSMLTTSALWFCNAEVLAKDDPFEGILPYGNYKHREWQEVGDVPEDMLEKFKSTRYTRVEHPEQESIQDKINGEKSIRELRIRQAFLYRKQKYVNCWHESNFESAAMWRVYGYDNNGVAIVSQSKRILGAFRDNPEEFYCGKVKYLDYENDVVDLNNGFYPIVRKRLSFEYEREVRLVFSDGDVSHQVFPTINSRGEIGRIYVPRPEEEVETYQAASGRLKECVLQELIQEIRVSPTADGWIEDAIRSLCAKFGLAADIIRKSNLYSDPIR